MKKKIFCETCGETTNHVKLGEQGFLTKLRSIKDIIYECIKCKNKQTIRKEEPNEKYSTLDER